MKKSLIKYFLNAIIVILFTLMLYAVTIFVLAISFSTQNNNYFTIQEIELELVNFPRNKQSTDTLLQKLHYGDSCNQWMMRINLKKVFIEEGSLSSSRFGKSTAYAIPEPGRKGIVRKIEKFNVYYKDSLGEKLYMNEYLKLIDNKVLHSCWGIDTMNNGLLWRECKEALTLQALILALNENKRFASGTRLNGDVYFTVDEEMSRLLLNRDLYLEVKMGKVHKYVQIHQNKKVTITLYGDE